MSLNSGNHAKRPHHPRIPRDPAKLPKGTLVEAWELAAWVGLQASTLVNYVRDGKAPAHVKRRANPDGKPGNGPNHWELNDGLWEYIKARREGRAWVNPKRSP